MPDRDAAHVSPLDGQECFCPVVSGRGTICGATVAGASVGRPKATRETTPDPDEAVRVCHGVLWLADNIHNYGSGRWRAYFMACVRDARRVVGYESERETG